MPPATGRQNGPAGGISCAYPSPSLVETYLPAARRSDCDSSGTVRDFHPASPVGGPASAGPPLRPGIQKSVLLFAPRMTPCAFKGGCRPGISQTGRAALRLLYHTLPRRTSRSHRCANAVGCQTGNGRHGGRMTVVERRPSAQGPGGRLVLMRCHRSRPQCRAGDLARRMGVAALQGFRDDASIVPYGCRARLCRALQDISSAKRQCTPPSAPYGASTVRFAVPASHGAR